MTCTFIPVNRSWVAFAENPSAVVLWIGGAFFGTLPTVCYSFLLEKIVQANYTVVALPYWLNLNHSKKAETLYEEYLSLPQALTQAAKKRGYEWEIYKHLTNYIWAGHSLGCEYITLLYFLNQPRERQHKILRECLENTSSSSLARNLKNLEEIDQPVAMENQPALLIAPCFKAPKLIQGCVFPKQKTTRCLLSKTAFTSKLAMISFKDDHTAGSLTHKEGDVYWISQNLTPQKGNGLISNEEIKGNHYTPVFCDEALANWVRKYLELLSKQKK